MALNIISNFAANVAQRNLSISDRAATRSVAKLSSGTRVLAARDDAASLAIGSRLRAEVGALRQANVNAGQASSLLQVADGALSTIGDILVRMKALAVQSASGNLGTSERSVLQLEFNALQREIDRIAQDTEFNGVKLIDDQEVITTQLGDDTVPGTGADLRVVNNVISTTQGIESINFGAGFDSTMIQIDYSTEGRTGTFTVTDLSKAIGSSARVATGTTRLPSQLEGATTNLRPGETEAVTVVFDSGSATQRSLTITLNSDFSKTGFVTGRSETSPTGNLLAGVVTDQAAAAGSLNDMINSGMVSINEVAGNAPLAEGVLKVSYSSADQTFSVSLNGETAVKSSALTGRSGQTGQATVTVGGRSFEIDVSSAFLRNADIAFDSDQSNIAPPADLAGFTDDGDRLNIELTGVTLSGDANNDLASIIQSLKQAASITTRDNGGTGELVLNVGGASASFATLNNDASAAFTLDIGGSTVALTLTNKTGQALATAGATVAAVNAATAAENRSSGLLNFGANFSDSIGLTIDGLSNTVFADQGSVLERNFTINSAGGVLAGLSNEIVVKAGSTIDSATLSIANALGNNLESTTTIDFTNTGAQTLRLQNSQGDFVTVTIDLDQALTSDQFQHAAVGRLAFSMQSINGSGNDLLTNTKASSQGAIALTGTVAKMMDEGRLAVREIGGSSQSSVVGLSYSAGTGLFTATLNGDTSEAGTAQSTNLTGINGQAGRATVTVGGRTFEITVSSDFNRRTDVVNNEQSILSAPAALASAFKAGDLSVDLLGYQLAASYADNPNRAPVLSHILDSITNASLDIQGSSVFGGGLTLSVSGFTGALTDSNGAAINSIAAAGGTVTATLTNDEGNQITVRLTNTHATQAVEAGTTQILRTEDAISREVNDFVSGGYGAAAGASLAAEADAAGLGGGGHFDAATTVTLAPAGVSQAISVNVDALLTNGLLELDLVTPALGEVRIAAKAGLSYGVNGLGPAAINANSADLLAAGAVANTVEIYHSTPAAPGVARVDTLIATINVGVAVAGAAAGQTTDNALTISGLQATNHNAATNGYTGAATTFLAGPGNGGSINFNNVDLRDSGVSSSAYNTLQNALEGGVLALDIVDAGGVARIEGKDGLAYVQDRGAGLAAPAVGDFGQASADLVGLLDTQEIGIYALDSDGATPVLVATVTLNGNFTAGTADETTSNAIMVTGLNTNYQHGGSNAAPAPAPSVLQGGRGGRFGANTQIAVLTNFTSSASVFDAEQADANLRATTAFDAGTLSLNLKQTTPSTASDVVIEGVENLAFVTQADTDPTDAAYGQDSADISGLAAGAVISVFVRDGDGSAGNNHVRVATITLVAAVAASADGYEVSFGDADLDSGESLKVAFTALSNTVFTEAGASMQASFDILSVAGNLSGLDNRIQIVAGPQGTTVEEARLVIKNAKGEDLVARGAIDGTGDFDPTAPGLQRITLQNAQGDSVQIAINLDHGGLTQEQLKNGDVYLMLGKLEQSAIYDRDTKSSREFTFKVGSGAEAADDVTFDVQATNARALGVHDTGNNAIRVDGSDATYADQASVAISTAIERLNNARSIVGAGQNRLEFASNSVAAAIENAEAARSTLLDLDVAAEISVYTSKQILVQTGISILAQANQQPQQLLRLFQ